MATEEADNNLNYRMNYGEYNFQLKLTCYCEKN